MRRKPESGIANIRRLAYFESFFDPVAERMLVSRPEIALVSLRYAAPEAESWHEMERVHGYQIKPRGELVEPWFGNEALLRRCPNLLAISSSGAGFDMVDVDACTAAGVVVCNQSGFNKEAVAEHTLGFMLSLAKKIGIDRVLRRESVRDRFRFIGNDIRSKTVASSASARSARARPSCAAVSSPCTCSLTIRICRPNRSARAARRRWRSMNSSSGPISS